MGFFPYICRMRLLRRDLSCLLKVFYCFKILFYSANNDIFFVLHSMEEGDAMSGVATALLIFRSLFVEESQFL